MRKRSRAERLEKLRSQRKRIALGAGAAALALIAVAALVAGVSMRPSSTPEALAEADPALLATTATAKLAAPSAAATSAALPSEVPTLTGMPIAEAEVLLKAAGLALTRVGTPAGDVAPGWVLDQQPAPGERMAPGSVVTLTFADPSATESTATPRPAGFVVCIDPGHQANANTNLEPVGPGANETKPKVSGGATGVTTRVPEHEIALAVSLKVRDRLERYGVTVVMTRTTANVDISNAQRAQVANNAGAHLFLRIHADSSTNASRNGVSTLYPGGNEWVAPITQPSRTAAGVIQREMLRSTGANDLALAEGADIAGFNWATVPSVLVETGFLSNPAEDKKLSDPAYQDKLADGIARGVLEYLGVTE